MIDLERHENILRQKLRVTDEQLIAYLMQRMRDGIRKYEERPQAENRARRDFIAEGKEEIVDGMNRLVMEFARREEEGVTLRDVYAAMREIRRAIRALERIER